MIRRRFTLDGRPYEPEPDRDGEPLPDDVYSAEDAFRPRPPPVDGDGLEDDDFEGEEGRP